jgi:catechol 2,3-dioxygenase-like lactoylglutathione lyase family enzyme
MGIEIVEINHVNITVPKSAEEEAKHFYGVVLGLQEIQKPEESRGRGGAWYQLGDMQLHLSLEELGAGHASKRHVCYLVHDLNRAQEFLRNAGVEIIPDDRPVRGWARFYLRDPGGNRVEVAQNLSAEQDGTAA